MHDSRYILFLFFEGRGSSSIINRPFSVSLSFRYLFSTRILVCTLTRTRTQKQTTRNKMAFSMTSALSSRVSATTSSLRTQRVQKRQSASFKCNALSEAEIDKRYPQGGSVYKVCFSFFSRSLSSLLSLSFSLCRLIRDTNEDNATFARRVVLCQVCHLSQLMIVFSFLPGFAGLLFGDTKIFARFFRTTKKRAFDVPMDDFDNYCFSLLLFMQTG